MGEFADYANDEQAQSLEDLLEYESGQISELEAIERGVLNEDGSIPTNITTWGVHDVESLASELDRCELAFRRVMPDRTKELFWVSNGKPCKPTEMTTMHLKNAIAYAERSGMNGPVVRLMRRELEHRTTHK